jgi:hypothetical protein
VPPKVGHLDGHQGRPSGDPAAPCSNSTQPKMGGGRWSIRSGPRSLCRHPLTAFSTAAHSQGADFPMRAPAAVRDPNTARKPSLRAGSRRSERRALMSRSGSPCAREPFVMPEVGQQWLTDPIPLVATAALISGHRRSGESPRPHKGPFNTPPNPRLPNPLGGPLPQLVVSLDLQIHQPYTRSDNQTKR